MAFSISGTAYLDNGVTPMGSGRTVKVSVNGAAASVSTTTASDGTFTLSGVVGILQVVTVYLQGNTEVGVGVTTPTGNTTNVTGLAIYQDTLLIQKPTGANNPTAANLGASDNNGDSGITSIYSCDGTTITTASGKHLYVASGANLASNLNLSVAGDLIVDGTCSPINGTTTTLTGSGTRTWKTNGGTYDDVVVNAPSGTYILTGALTTTSSGGGNLTVTAGTLDVSSGNYAISVGGAFSVSASGSFNARSGTLTMAASTTSIYALDPGSSSLCNLVITNTNSAGIVRLTNNNLTLTGTLTLNGNSTSQFDANDLNITVAGLCTVTSGKYLAKAGTQTFNGGLTLSASTATFTGSSGAVDVNGSLTITAGTFTAPSGTFTISGNFAHSSGTFTAGTNTVTLDGAAQTISGSTTFYDLVCATPGDVISFTDGTTQTVSNSFTAQNVTLQGTGSAGWTVAMPATQTIDHVTVSYSTATGNTAVAGAGSVEGVPSSNVNWTFPLILSVQATVNESLDVPYTQSAVLDVPYEQSEAFDVPYLQQATMRVP